MARDLWTDGLIIMALMTFDKVLKVIQIVLNILVVALNSLQGLPISKDDTED